MQGRAGKPFSKLLYAVTEYIVNVKGTDFSEFACPLQVGGGINPSNAQKYIDAGASHVIVTSYVFTDGTLNMARYLNPKP